jgi:hypothetical protein
MRRPCVHLAMEELIVKIMEVTDFWDVAPCNLIITFWKNILPPSSGKTEGQGLRLKVTNGNTIFSVQLTHLPWKEVAGSSGMLVPLY